MFGGAVVGCRLASGDRPSRVFGWLGAVFVVAEGDFDAADEVVEFRQPVANEAEVCEQFIVAVISPRSADPASPNQYSHVNDNLTCC